MGGTKTDPNLVPTPTSASVFLREEFERRTKKNPRFSLRAFARFLGVAPGTLSEIFSNKRALTEALAMRFAERLPLTKAERAKFVERVVQEQRLHEKTKPLKKMGQDGAAFSFIEEDQFAIIADWYHFALLALSETRDFNSDPEWLAQKLGLKPNQIHEALYRLERLGLIERLANGSFRTTQTQLRTRSDIASRAVKQFHKQSLSRAQSKLDDVPVPYRDITSMTMAIDTSKLGLAKELIQNFRRQMAALLEEGPRDDVFQLNIQLIPLTEKGPTP